MQDYKGLRDNFLNGKYSRRQFVKLSLAAGVSAGAISSFLAGCAPVGTAPGGASTAASSTGAKIKLLYWTVLGNVDGIIMDSLVKEFTNANPDIAIESLQGVEDFEAKLQSSVLTGTGPDLTLFRLNYVGPYAARSVVVPMDSSLLSGQGVVKENFDSRVWDATFYEGNQYAIPFDIHLFALFRNKALLAQAGLDPEQPPKTLTEWYDMAKAMNKGDIIGTAVYGWPPGMFWIYYGLLKQYGAELFLDEGTRVDLTTPAHVEPVEWWHNLRWDINPEAKNGDLVRTGKVGVWLDGPWTLSLWSDPERSTIVDNYAISMMPQHNPEQPAVWANSHCLALPKPAKDDPAKREAAISFVKWLTEHSFDWSNEAGMIPANNAVRNSEEWKTGDSSILQGSRAFADSMPYTHFLPQHPKMFEVADRIAAALDAAVNTQDTPAAEALQKATDEVNAILAQK